MHKEHKKVSDSFQVDGELNDSDCSEDYENDPMYSELPLPVQQYLISTLSTKVDLKEEEDPETNPPEQQDPSLFQATTTDEND